MTDLVDFANDLVQESIDQALATRAAAKSVMAMHSFLFCEGCDDPIPEARRLVLPGCSRCVICQSIDESREARHAR